MKSNPDLVVVEPEKFQNTEVRQHLNASVTTMFNDPSPVKGYAIVTFHENGGYGTAFHAHTAGIHQIDLPDMVSNHLRANIIKNGG